MSEEGIKILMTSSAPQAARGLCGSLALSAADDPLRERTGSPTSPGVRRPGSGPGSRLPPGQAQFPHLQGGHTLAFDAVRTRIDVSPQSTHPLPGFQRFLALGELGLK